MKTIIKTLAIILLSVNGIGAVYGGLMLIADPTGSKLQMPLTFLEQSPFNNYLIPGIILLIINGIFSFVVIATIVLKKAYCHLLTLAQGILLCGWIIIQMILLKMFYAPMHITFLVIGACLIGCGFYLKGSKDHFKVNSASYNNEQRK